MRAITHIAASTAAAAAAYPAAGVSGGLGILLLGGFLDVDHLGHFISSGLPARPSALFHSVFRNEKQLERKYSVRRGIPGNVLFPALHCVEIMVLLLSAGLLFGSGFLAWGAAGVSLHLVMDLRSYPCSPGFFSMTWRLLNRKRLLEAWRGHRSEVRW